MARTQVISVPSFQSVPILHHPRFKADSRALLEKLQGGIAKKPEHLRFDIALFAETWFKLGQENAPARELQEVAPALPETIKPQPRRGLAPRSRAIDPSQMAKMEFLPAAKAWLDTGRVRLKKRTVIGYEQYIKQLSVYFDGMTLNEIHLGHLLEYQVCRSENTGAEWFQPTEDRPTPWPRRSEASNTNHELNTLQQILRMASLWAPLDDAYVPLPPPGFKKPMVMTDLEKRRFYVVAASKPEWSLALWAATITNCTSASGVELRNLRLCDISLDGEKPSIYINSETAKCRNRGRTIELNADAVDALRKCKERAAKLGSFREDHYLFPFRVKTNGYNPSLPASNSWLNKAWRELRDAAGLPWLTPHCLRHQCLTELHENGVAPEVIRKIAGHLSPEMTDHYSHVRRDQQAAALNTLAPIAEVTKKKREKRAEGANTPAQRRVEISRLLRGRRGIRRMPKG